MEKQLSGKAMEKFPDYKTVLVSSLIPYARNSRTHSDTQVGQIAASIKEFGFLNPIIVDGESGIIAGHGRVLAAQKLGLAELPVIEAGHLSDTQRRAYIIADNKLAMNAGWDDEILRVELDALGVDGFDLELTGFSLDEIADLQIEEVPEGLTDDDSVPESLEDPVTVEGDVWVLDNKHRLLCGNATSIDAVEKLMDGQKADMVFTDPPYGMSLDADFSKMGSDKIKPGKKHENIIGDEKDFDPTQLLELFSYCNDIVIFGADYFAENIIGKNDGAWLVWDKRVEERYDKIIGSAFELIWTKRKVKRAIIRHEYVSWESRMADKVEGKKPHPTMKPVKMLEMVLKKFNQREGDLTVDLFGGSGSTLIACEKTNRHCRIMELSPAYCDVIINRWQKYTGKEAVLESTGETYNSKMTA